MATSTYQKAQECVTVTTMNLRAGDTIQTGNMWDGFWTYTIQEITPSPYSKTKMAVTILYNHGGSYIEYSGKNTRWSVVKAVK
jgi:hypothetical protein